MPVTLSIDFVSDVSCPWCAIGLASLEQALRALEGEVDARITLRPFELNPNMPAGGQDIGEHIAQKYGSSPQQQARTRETIRQRGAEAGFEFAAEGRSRIYNTFDAHRLLHWAGVEGRPDGEGGLPGQQRLLKKALFAAYFTHGRSPESHDTLLDAARAAGLDTQRARQVLESGEYADAVRADEAWSAQRDITAVPATIVNGAFLIPGGQPADVFERLLRKVAQRA